MMNSHNDLFSQINNAVLDLQGAQLQTYERPLKTLARLLHHPDLDAANKILTENLSLDEFLARQKNGSFADAHLEWPESPEQVLGLSLLLIDKFAQEPNFILNFGRSYFFSGPKIIANLRAVIGQMIIPFVRDYKAFVESNGTPKVKFVVPVSNKVFIVHGHDGEAREAVARFLEKIEFVPIILHEQANKGRTIIEKVEDHSEVGFAVVLLTPDDQGCAEGGKLEPRVRQNVLLELGYFIGRLGRDRVCTLKRGEVDIPSDFAGVVWETMDASNGWKMALGRELEAAGHIINWNQVMK